MSKRKMYIAAGVAALTLAVSSTGNAEELVIAGWSGGYDKIFDNELMADYLKKNDITVRWVLGGSVANVARVKASRDNPDIDIALVDDLPQRSGIKDGLWAPLDPAIVTNLADLRKVALLPGNQGVSFAIDISGLIYQPEIFKEKSLPPPTSWKDLFRADLKGRVALPSLTTGEGLAALLAFARINGGDEHNIDPGFELAKKLAPSVGMFPPDAGVVGTLFQRREMWISVDPLDYAAISKKNGLPMEFAFPSEGAAARTYTISVVKGAPHLKRAEEFVNALLSPAIQSKLVPILSLGPVNSHAEVPSDIVAMLDKIYPVDVDYINSQRQAWIERWNREIESK